MQKRVTLLLSVGGLFVMPIASLQAAVPIPEYWGGSDWLGFFIIASIACAMMIRLKVLKPRIGR
jgi:hypothetical protein